MSEPGATRVAPPAVVALQCSAHESRRPQADLHPFDRAERRRISAAAYVKRAALEGAQFQTEDGRLDKLERIAAALGPRLS